jgi:hypothetical protein
MKKKLITLLIATLSTSINFAQVTTTVDAEIKVTTTKANYSPEKYGNTINAGLGIGYYGYIGYSIPVVHLNYEFDVAKNLTLAPFITYYSYTNRYYWGNPHYDYRYYSYHQTVIPIGVKGTYYFDQLLHADAKWDFYLAGSIGFAYRSTRWENGYYGETVIHNRSSGLYLDAHIGTEYHLSKKIGLYLDLSTGISTFGLAVHL